MRIVLSIVFLLLFTSQAHAFHEVRSFAESANIGGGAGNYFTGSPDSKGYQCQLCHLKAEQRISIDIASALTAGTYKAGLVYTVSLRLIGEHKGLDSAFNPNTFTAQITDAEGTPVGAFAGNEIELLNQNTLVIAEGFGNGEDAWEFSWWAPETAVPATLYIAMLDGDGAGETERRFIDPLNDDFAALQIVLCPEGQRCEPPAPPPADISPAGCSTGGKGASSVVLLGILLCIWPAFRRRTGR